MHPFVFADAFVQIIRDEGVGALWNGTFPSLLLVLNPAIQFMIYEGLKRQLKRGVPREVSEKEGEIRDEYVNSDVWRKGKCADIREVGYRKQCWVRKYRFRKKKDIWEPKWKNYSSQIYKSYNLCAQTLNITIIGRDTKNAVSNSIDWAHEHRHFQTTPLFWLLNNCEMDLYVVVLQFNRRSKSRSWN